MEIASSALAGGLDLRAWLWLARWSGWCCETKEISWLLMHKQFLTKMTA
jgi:hypothetical protein